MNRFIVEIALCAIMLAGMRADAMPLGIRTLMHGRAAVRQAEELPSPEPTQEVWTVTFDAQGGTAAEATRSVTNGCAVGELPAATREGFTFDGWFSSAQEYELVTAETVVTNDITFLAQWAINQYVVTFDANGGDGSVTNELDFASGIVAPEVSRTGYTFAGWSPKAGASVPASNVVYTAQWTVNQYTMTFDANGGEGGTSVTQDYGSELAAPTVTRSGYAFAGWSPAAPATIPASNAVYIAQWRYSALGIDLADAYETNADGAFELDLKELLLVETMPRLTFKGLPAGLKFDAKTGVISGKATKSGTYKVTVSATNATQKQPVTAEFEIVVPNLASEKLPGLEQDTKAYGVVMCGVALPTDLVDCTPEDGWTVKAAGLPAGLRFTAKDVVDPKTKKVTAPANTVYGVPTKAGTFTVTFTATKRGEPNQVATITMRVEALPAWAQGTFAGYAAGDDGGRGSATMTVAANGRVSGKVSLGGTNWTFSAASFSRVEYASGTNLVVEAVAKAGKAERAIELSVSACAGGPAGTSLVNGTATGGFVDGSASLVAWRNVWKDRATASAAKAAIGPFVGVYTVSVADGTDYGCGYLSLTVGKDGTTRATGKLADGTSVTATSPLMYDEDAGWFVALYAAPSAYKGGSFAAAVGFGARLAPVLFTPQWTSRNPQATGEYGDGFERDVDLAGAYYNKLDTLRRYYESLRLELNGAPELGFVLKETSLNELGRKVTASSASTASAVDTLGQDSLTATVDASGKLVVAKATRPVQDKETKEWSYEGPNDGALTLSFTQATGVFRGSYTFWYDYMSAYDETTDKETWSHISKKASFEGILVQGEDPKMDGFYLWDASSEYEDEKTGKAKAYKYKQSFPVRLLAE